jgi:hypothetical protein
VLLYGVRDMAAGTSCSRPAYIRDSFTTALAASLEKLLLCIMFLTQCRLCCPFRPVNFAPQPKGRNKSSGKEPAEAIKPKPPPPVKEYDVTEEKDEDGWVTEWEDLCWLDDAESKVSVTT